MKNTIFILSALMIGILLFGCVTNNVTNNETNVTVQSNTTTQSNTTVQPGALELSVPSELPIAYVGTPYIYSFCNPQSEQETGGFNTHECGVNVTSTNPTGGKPPYEVSIHQYTANISKSPDWYVSGLYVSGSGLLNFTPKKGDEGQYVLEVCAEDSAYPSDTVCKNTTLYIMSDTVTVKGDGKLTYDLWVKLNSDVQASDFAGNKDAKDIITPYAPTATFSPLKVTAEVPAASQCDAGTWCGGGSSAEVDVTADANGASMTAEGSAPCGKALVGFPGEYFVDYYHTGYTHGYGDPDILLALDINNTGTKEKAVDIYLNVSSELDPGSQHYVGGVNVESYACIGDHCISVQAVNPGDMMVNSTVLRVLVRPGRHVINYAGTMKDSFSNTNTVKCPSFAKSSSSVSITIVPADISDGKKAIGSIYSYQSGNSSKSDVK